MPRFARWETFPYSVMDLTRPSRFQKLYADVPFPEQPLATLKTLLIRTFVGKPEWRIIPGVNLTVIWDDESGVRILLKHCR